MRFNLEDYETVEARLAKFWAMHPNGRVATTIEHYDDNKVVFRAAIYRDIVDLDPVSTGYAEEVRDASPVNRTCHVENAETSAIGRALANYVLQSKTLPRPSREEMEKVARREEKPDLLARFKEACNKAGLNHEDVAREAGVSLDSPIDESISRLRDAFKKMSQEPAKVEGEIAEVVTTPEPNSLFPKEPAEKVTKLQVGKIRAMLNSKGVRSFAQKTEVCAEIICRPLTKMEDLTQGEASQIIDVLDARAS